MFNDNGNIKPWKDLKIEFHLKYTRKIYWLQIIDALPKTWKDIILKDKPNAKKFVIFDHHIVWNSQTCNLNKLTSKELYLILVEANTVKLTAQDYFESFWNIPVLNNFLIRDTTLDTMARVLQYNVLHNILYANKMLFKFGKVTSPRCSFC